MGILAQSFALIALIQKKARLLSLPGIDKKQHIIFTHSHLRGNTAGHHFWFLDFQALAAACLAIIAQ